ncbi:MAG: GTPase Era [Deinococcales bacterium]
MSDDLSGMTSSRKDIHLDDTHLDDTHLDDTHLDKLGSDDVGLDNPMPSFQRPSDKPSHAGFVAIVGRPNVGKSTLLNTMLGVKVAPISAKPQTTRRGVRGIFTDVDSNRQLIFVDTPGLHQAKTDLDSFMNQEIQNAILDVDRILWVVDLRRPPQDEDKDVARMLMNLEEDVPIYLVGNKLDAAKYPEEALEYYRDLCPKISEVRLVSAMQDPKSVYALRDELLGHLPESPHFFPDNIRSDQSREAWVADIIRESCMVHLYQEIPYSIAVNVLEWREKTKHKPLYIYAELWVEKKNHRMILLGKQGRMIKEIGRSARKQLEIFLNEQIYLDLEVVVKEGWRDDTEALLELGYF